MKKKQKLVIPLSESDLQDLQAGETFDWTFPTNKGEDIDIHLRLETQEDIDPELGDDGEPISDKDVIRDNSGDEVEQ